MPELQAAVETRWTDGTDLQAAVQTRWTDGTDVQSVGSAYTPPAVGGGTVVTPGSLLPAIDVLPATAYSSNVTLVVKDLRDDTVLMVTSVTVSFSDGSVMWALDAQADASAAAKLSTGDQPPTISVQIGIDKWHFVVEDIEQPRVFAQSAVTLRGRSLAALAGDPYQVQQQWLADAPTTAAQVCAIAQTFTDLVVRWNVDDWQIPEGAWSANADPLGVVTGLAASILADVEADRTELAVTVKPRYPTVPITWATTAPDWQFPWAVVESTRQERADQPEYDSVVVASSGLALSARMAGTSGSRQAPLISDTKLTDAPALRQRAEASLAGYGKQVREERTLPIRTRVVRRGELVRFVEPSATWVGLVRSVSVTATLEKARQTITMERRTAFISGVYVPAPIPAPRDPLFAQVVALFHFNESPGAASVVDSSIYGVTATLAGDGLEVSTVSPKWGSGHLRATQRQPTGIAVAGARFNRSAGQALTVECWVRKASTANATATPPLFMLVNSTGSTVFYVWQYSSPGSQNRLQVLFPPVGVSVVDIPTSAIGADGYVFLQLTADTSDAWTLRAGGTVLLTGTSAVSWSGSGTTLLIGGTASGVPGATIEVDIDEFRMTVGALRSPDVPNAPFPDLGP